MTASPSVFHFDSKTVRVIHSDGVIWFVAQDLMAALDYAKTSRAAKIFEHVPVEWGV